MAWILRRGEGLTLAALVLFALAMMALPLGRLMVLGLSGAQGLSLSPLLAALTEGAVQRALLRSLQSAAISALIALGLGVAMALLIGLCDLRAKGIATFLLLLPMMIPPHVTAIAWVQALGPGSPVLGALGLAPAPGSPNPLYSAGGVIALLALQQAPLVFLVMLSAIRALPREISEAARIAGAGPWRLLGRIVLPLLAPAAASGFGLAFVSALGNFGIPAILGIPARYVTLPVLIWRRLSGFGPAVLGDVAVLSALLAFVALAVIALQRLSQRRFAARLIGPPQPSLRLALGRGRGVAELGLLAYLLATLGLPMLALLATALVPTYGVALSLRSISLENFTAVLAQAAVGRAFVNSTLVAGLAALVLAGLAVLLARQGEPGGGGMRRAARVRIAAAISSLAEVAYAIPGLVISIAFILAFLHPLPGLGWSLYNTLAIILLAYLAAFFSVALKPVAAASAQLDPGLVDAARVCGARYGRRLTRIEAPLLAPAAASGAILVFLTAYNEVTVSALLWSAGHETIGTAIFNLEDSGATTMAAAMAVLTVLATVVLMLVLDWLGRRLPAGVVPWRL